MKADPPKTDPISKAIKFVDHNRWVVAAVVLVAVFLSGGMSPKAPGLDGQMVTKPEFEKQIIDAHADIERRAMALQSEAEALAQKAEITRHQFAEAEGMRKVVLQTIAGIVTTAAELSGVPGGAAGVDGVLGLAGLLIAGGTLADSRRKDKVIKQRGGGHGDVGGDGPPLGAGSVARQEPAGPSEGAGGADAVS